MSILKYISLANSRNFLWLGKESAGNRHIWMCQFGHIWRTRYDHFRDSGGCPYCSGITKKTDNDYHDLAQRQGIWWIDKTIPKSVMHKTLWKCKCGNEWKATYNTINKNGVISCPECVVKRFRHSLNAYRQLAFSRGFEWVDTSNVKNTSQNTLWKCKEGHTWYAPYDNIKAGSGCPHCSGIARKTEQDYRDLAESFDLIWTGKRIPINTKQKTSWQCGQGHSFRRPYDTLRVCSSSGCPICAKFVNGCRVSTCQLRLAKTIKGVVNYRFESRYIDVALVEQRTAIEYYGWHWHKNRQKEDRERERQLLSGGWKLCIVKAGRKLPRKYILLEALERLSDTNIIEIVLDDWKGYQTNEREI